ncbi:MAG: tetratricopeptide repeat protein [Steroidobacteraceae bacterium]
MSGRAATCLVLLWAMAPLVSLAHDDLARQLERLDRAIGTDPTEVELYLQRAALHHAHQDTAAALADLTRAEALNPANAGIWLLRGRVLLESGQASLALPALERCLDLQPGDGLTLALRARARSQTGDPAGAEADYAAATASLARPGPELVLERSQNLQSAGRSREALAVLDEGLRELEGAAALWEAALALEIQMGRWTEALARFDTPLQRPGSRAALLARRAQVFDLAGQPEAATLDRRQALEELDALPAARRRTPANLELRRTLESRLP